MFGEDNDIYLIYMLKNERFWKKKSIGLWKFNSKDKIYVNLFTGAWKNRL